MCSKNNSHDICGANKRWKSDRDVWSLLLLAATMQSFAYLPLGLYDRTKISAVTRMWRSCRVQPSHKERAIGAVHCKKEGMLLQPLGWRCVWYNDSLQTGCSRRNAPVCMWRIQAINEPSHLVLLLAAVVRSFALLPLGLSDRNDFKPRIH